MASKNLISPSAYYIKTVIAHCPVKIELLARVQKEYQIFEYFADLAPKYLADKHWNTILCDCKSPADRVKFFKSTAIVQEKDENEMTRKIRKREFFETALKSEEEKLLEGGMGYGPGLYNLYRSPHRNDTNHAISCGAKVASSIIVGDMPTIALDMQFISASKQRDRYHGMMITHYLMALSLNSSLPRAFPLEIVNADAENSQVQDFLNGAHKASNYLKHRENKFRCNSPDLITYPDIHKDNPYQYSNSYTDPSKKVIYVSMYAREIMDGPLIAGTYIFPVAPDTHRQTAFIHKTGNFHVMRPPIDKYLVWKCGQKYIPLPTLLAIFSDVASGDSWKVAMLKRISSRHFTEVSEKPFSDQIRYKKWNERKAQMGKIHQMVAEAFQDPVEMRTNEENSAGF